jgi:5'-3' exonuclease
VQVHLVDGTYELFRHYFAVPSRLDASGREVGAVVGVVESMLRMLEGGATHLGVATDHVIESFRNEMWAGYKDGSGIEPELRQQFGPLEEALGALGVAVWPMVELEADDGMAAAARTAAADAAVERVLICTPDKDLAQCVVDDRVVQFDRRANTIRNDEGVRERFGVEPESIPDYLALVGDSADGFPGIRGWGAKSTAIVLAHYRHLEAIPPVALQWEVEVRGAMRLASALTEGWDDALLFRDLATLRDETPLFDSVDEIRWSGPRVDFDEWAIRLGVPMLIGRVAELAGTRGER